MDPQRDPTLHVLHESPPDEGVFLAGTPGVEFKPEATPLPGEPVITKHVNSAFIGTDLEERLRADGVDTVAIVGLTTDREEFADVIDTGAAISRMSSPD
jgi:nicotinamidase-related amidase